MTNTARRAQSTLPTRTRSDTTVSYRNPPDLVPDTSSGDESDDESESQLTMSPAEIRVLRRLSSRCNVLPVIARADSLTDDKLAAVKAAVRTGLFEAGLSFGVFGPPPVKNIPEEVDTAKRQTRFARNGTDRSDANGHGVVGEDAEQAEEEGDGEERQSRPVIKLRPRHTERGLSRSRSRRDLSRAADDERRPMSPDAGDTESVANVRFSAHIVAKTDLSNLMPFALIAPEITKHSHRHRSSVLSTAPSSPTQQSEDGHAASIDLTPETPMSVTSARMAYLEGPPADLRGVFTRKFRWGTVDVLNPEHCDFAALRTAVLSTHLKVCPWFPCAWYALIDDQQVLKTHTKEVLYEKYRTEKLLARRATRQITDDERQRLLEGVHFRSFLQ